MSIARRDGEDFRKPAGTLICPRSWSPPSDDRAVGLECQTVSVPAAMAKTLLKPPGTLVSPYSLNPQATTVPSDLSARLYIPPPQWRGRCSSPRAP